MFLHIGPTMKNSPELPGPAEEWYDGRARAADPLPGVKEDQMMGPEVFSALQQPDFLRGREAGSGATDVVACSAALRSYLCSFQFRLSPD